MSLYSQQVWKRWPLTGSAQQRSRRFFALSTGLIGALSGEMEMKLQLIEEIEEVAVALQEGEDAPGYLDDEQVARLRRYLAAGPNVFARAASDYTAGAIVSVLFSALSSLDETLVPDALAGPIIEHCSSSNPNQDADLACVDRLRRLIVGFPEGSATVFKRLVDLLGRVHRAIGGASAMATSFAPLLFPPASSIAVSFKAISVVQLAVLYADRLPNKEEKYEAINSAIDAKARVKRAMSCEEGDSPHIDNASSSDRSPHEIAAIQRRWGTLLQESEDVFLSPGDDLDYAKPKTASEASPLRPNSDVIVATLRERLREEKEKNETLSRQNMLLTGAKEVVEHSLQEQKADVETLKKVLAVQEKARQQSFARTLAMWHRGWLQKRAAKQFYVWKAQSLQRRLERSERDVAEKNSIIDALEIEAAATVKEASEILLKSQQSMKVLKQRQALCAARFASLGALEAENRRLKSKLDQNSGSVACDLQSAAWALEQQLNTNDRLRRDNAALLDKVQKLEVSNTYLGLAANGSW